MFQGSNQVYSVRVCVCLSDSLSVCLSVLSKWHSQGGLHASRQSSSTPESRKFVHCAESLLASYEHMRQDPFWMPVMTVRKEGSWCDGGAKFAAKCQDELLAVAKSGHKCILSANVIRRLQTCFSPLVSCHLTDSIAAQTTACCIDCL